MKANMQSVKTNMESVTVNTQSMRVNKQSVSLERLYPAVIVLRRCGRPIRRESETKCEAQSLEDLSSLTPLTP